MKDRAVSFLPLSPPTPTHPAFSGPFRSRTAAVIHGLVLSIAVFSVTAVTASARSQGTTSSSRLRRHRVIDAAAKNLRRYYAYPDVGQKMADALLAHEKNGDDDAAADGAAFADLLTKQMRDVSHDRHLELAYSQDPLPASGFDAQGRPLGPTPDDHARYRKTMEQENCTFEKTEILAHNIGYLKLNSFPDPSLCRPTAVTAMAYLNHVDAIIFDLRNNRGGEPEMVALMAAYLFDRPEYWYNPRENTTPRSWTQSPVPGNRLADKPAYVLTSTRTFSGAEQFSYDLKMLKRAILVGETTGGAAHSGVFYRIDDHFGIGIPETKPINPFSKTDWAETGVEPDVKVKAADALETAVKLAESRVQSRRSGTTPSKGQSGSNPFRMNGLHPRPRRRLPRTGDSTSVPRLFAKIRVSELLCSSDPSSGPIRGSGRFIRLDNGSCWAQC